MSFLRSTIIRAGFSLGMRVLVGLSLIPIFQTTAGAQPSTFPEPGGQVLPARPLAESNGPPTAGESGRASDLGRDAASDAQPRVSNKAVVPASATAELADVAPPGMTYVALSQSLRRLGDGKEPSTLEELRELELQQSRVAEAIKSVTVNIQQGAAQGSGVIITSDGYVLTAAHVAGAPGRTAWVILNDGTRVRAETLGMNRNKDAGLIRIVDQSRPSWPYATLGRSADLKVGQWCVGAGHPGGWQPERGTVIRVGRIQKMSPHRRDAHTIFSDCALIGGDSGGPLFTLDGKLIAIHSRIGTEITENMHVPIDVFKESWERMAKKEAWGVLPGFEPPYIGVKGSGDPQAAAVINSVEPDGPAGLADVQPGDLILSVDEQPIQTFQDLVDAIAGYSPGDTVVLKIRRGDNTIQRPVTVGSRNSR